MEVIEICQVDLIETFDGGNRSSTVSKKRRNDLIKSFLRKGVTNEEFGHHFSLDFAEVKTPGCRFCVDRISKVTRKKDTISFCFQNEGPEYVWNFREDGLKL